MNSILIIFKKEMYRVFSDKKLVVSLFILPVILVVGIYGLMGVMIASIVSDQEEHIPSVYIINAPVGFEEYMKKYDISENVVYSQEVSDLDEQKQNIYDGNLDLLIQFDETFNNAVCTYAEGDSIPDIKTFYNPTEDYSQNAHDLFVDSIFADYKQTLLADRIGNLDMLTIFTIDADNSASIVQNDDKAQGKVLGSVIPYLMTILLFAGAMSLGADTIAGEKERGTMATLLISPIKRSDIVFGKLFALMVLSGLSSLVYGLTLIASMPVLAKTMGGIDGFKLSFSIGQIIMLLTIIVTLVFVYVALIALPSVFAKNVKEASTYIMPIYMIVMGSGMVTMFLGDDAKTFEYLIPLYGSAIALKNIFSTDISVLNFFAALVGNIVTGAVLSFILTKAFNSEKVMFDA